MSRQLMALTGVELLHVPDRGITPWLTDRMGGSIPMRFDTLPQDLDHIAPGRLRVGLEQPAAVRLAISGDVGPGLREQVRALAGRIVDGEVVVPEA